MPKSKREKPTVAIIGAGRLGRALGLSLSQSRYPIVALVARKTPKVGKDENFGSPKPKLLSVKELDLLPSARLIIISTPDDEIEETATRLGGILTNGSETTVLHTSGALSSAALAALAKKGIGTGSIHPLVSISDPLSGAKFLRGAYFCIEGARKARTAAAKIVRDLGGQSFTIKTGEKSLYHAAAVMASPHITALFDLATDLLAECGLTKPQSQKILMPLLESTVNNLRNTKPSASLTGTFARGDIATVRRHLHALSKSKSKTGEALTIYKALGLHSLGMTKINKNRRKEIEQLLQNSRR